MEVKARVVKMAREAKEASRVLCNIQAKVKNEALLYMADALEKKSEEILKENRKDLKYAEDKDLPAALIERLSLDLTRVADMAAGLRKVASLDDPVGEIVSGWKRPNSLEIKKIRVPFGLIGIIYESRPNVTCDAIGLCIKSGNSVMLEGGSEAINSNTAIAKVLAGAAYDRHIPKGSIQMIDNPSRDAVEIMLYASEYIDVIIPRGGAELIKMVKEESTVPIIETGTGNCHLYVDKDADLKMGASICVNAKTQRPGVCNAIETLLVHKDIAGKFLPMAYQGLRERRVEVRGCPDTRKILKGVKRATEDDWYAEFLDLILAVRVVDTAEEAIEHINKYGSKHSDAIITQNLGTARQFCRDVDSACVYVNSSTRFTDGGEFGMGSEIGISTQKLHARGPMGLRELTTVKYIIMGDGQVRQ